MVSAVSAMDGEKDHNIWYESIEVRNTRPFRYLASFKLGGNVSEVEDTSSSSALRLTKKAEVKRKEPASEVKIRRAKTRTW